MGQERHIGIQPLKNALTLWMAVNFCVKEEEEEEKEKEEKEVKVEVGFFQHLRKIYRTVMERCLWHGCTTFQKEVKGSRLIGEVEVQKG